MSNPRTEEDRKAEEIRRLCRCLTKSEMEDSLLKLATIYDIHYAVEATLRGKLEERHQKVESAQDIAEKEARKAYDDLYAELVAEYGKEMSDAPYDRKLELLWLFQEWCKTVDEGIKTMKKHDKELFEGEWKTRNNQKLDEF